MKKYCKDTDITDYNTIKTAMYKCLNGKLRRRDVMEYLLGENNPNRQDKNEYLCKIKTDFDYLDNLVTARSTELQKEIVNKDIKLSPILYKSVYDNNSCKYRNIATQSIKQQVCDYIALECLSPFFVYIGEYQIAGLPGRGTDYGVKIIKKWLRSKECKYAGKCDIKKCYESISHDKLLDFLCKHIRNDNLLWLIEYLVSTYQQGLSIGSLLSQYLCTLYLAQLYHDISERMYCIRRSRKDGNKRINLVIHVIFQMDDILIIGRNKRYIKQAMDIIKQKLSVMGLQMKSYCSIFEILKGNDKQNCGKRFIDIIGYRFYGYHVKVTLRRKTYKRFRRCYLRVKRDFQTTGKTSIFRARRLVSLSGRMKKINCFGILNKFIKFVDKCKKVISDYDKSKIYRRTTCCQI